MDLMHGLVAFGIIDTSNFRVHGWPVIMFRKDRSRRE